MKGNIVLAAIEAEQYMRKLVNVKNMDGPEYGIWHRLKTAIDDFNERDLKIVDFQIDKDFLEGGEI